ncbi:hypothetical protein ACQ4PT_037396 [Festuca glaucescens]
MFPASRGTPQLLLVVLYAGCFLLSSPLAPRHTAAAAPPISFSFDFSNQSLYHREDLRLEGNATVGANLVDLTCNSLVDSIGNCTGRMSYVRPVPFYKATDEVASFSTVFTFRIRLLDAQRPRKGDGMAFFLAAYPSALPPDSNGGGLGLIDRNANGSADGARRFIAVEFDTYTYNVSSDHIAIDLSTVKTSANTTSVASLAVAGTMTASVDFNSTTRSWSLGCTSMMILPCSQLKSARCCPTRSRPCSRQRWRWGSLRPQAERRSSIRSWHGPSTPRLLPTRNQCPQVHV